VSIRAGTAIRPALCLATAVAFGAELDEALPSAVALELLHNAFLIHDDIQDASLLRRGLPTPTPSTAPAGAQRRRRARDPRRRELRDNRRLLGSRLAARIGDEFDLMARRTLEGQRGVGLGRDVVLELEPDDYLDLIMPRRWYTTIHPLGWGLIGTWAARTSIHWCASASTWGGFPDPGRPPQPRGDESKYGKESCGDLYEGKRTLMVIHLLREARGDDHRAVGRILAMERQQRTPGDVATILELDAPIRQHRLRARVRPWDSQGG
jgi:geranylgeranyl diphosphate synthase type II